MSTKTLRFKVLLVGDVGVGKSTFLQRLQTGHFTTTYTPTFGVEVMPLEFRCQSQTGQHNIILTLWDMGGSHLEKSYFQGADAIIGMLDLTRISTYMNLRRILEDHPSLPLVICGNKCELRERKIDPVSLIQLSRRYQCSYYDISAKSLYNQDKPFLSILRLLTRDNTLSFCEIIPSRL